MNKVHAPLSPSKRIRYRSCPGSAKYPDTVASGPAAIDGTHSHTLLERCIKGGVTDPLINVGITLEDEDGTFTVNSERAQRVKVAIDYVRQRQLHLSGMCEVYAETRSDPARLVGRDDMSGHYDISIIGGGVFELIDYKDGMHPVSAEKNPQMEQYAVGALAEYPVRPYPFAEIWLTIIQPKLAAKGLPAVSTWRTTVDDIMDRVVTALQREGAACDDPNAPRIPGEDQCRYCPAKGFCPEFAAYTLNSAGISFPNTTETARQVMNNSTILNIPSDMVEQAAGKDPTSMAPEEIVRIIEAAPLLRQMIAAVEEEALRRLNDGKAIPGLKLVAGRGSRKWALPDDQIADKLKTMGVPKDVIWRTTLVSPAQIEKAAWHNRKGDSKTLSPKQQATVQKEYVARIEGKPTIALESDDRPSLTKDASVLFGAVEIPQPAPSDLPAWLT